MLGVPLSGMVQTVGAGLGVGVGSGVGVGVGVGSGVGVGVGAGVGVGEGAGLQMSGMTLQMVAHPYVPTTRARAKRIFFKGPPKFTCIVYQLKPAKSRSKVGRAAVACRQALCPGAHMHEGEASVPL